MAGADQDWEIVSVIAMCDSKQFDIRFSQFFNSRGQSEVSMTGATFSGLITMASSSLCLTSAIAALVSRKKADILDKGRKDFVYFLQFANAEMCCRGRSERVLPLLVG